jgi:hypothetical protein
LQLPFFIEIDPQGRSQRARGPLGALSVWLALGRRVVVYLTTQTTSFSDRFATFSGKCGSQPSRME